MAQEGMVVQVAAAVLGGAEPQMCKLVEQVVLETRHQLLHLKVTMVEMEIQMEYQPPLLVEAAAVALEQ
jgi:hypothetical protein